MDVLPCLCSICDHSWSVLEECTYLSPSYENGLILHSQNGGYIHVRLKSVRTIILFCLVVVSGLLLSGAMTWFVVRKWR